MTSCQVSVKLKIGPLAAQITIKKVADRKAQLLPLSSEAFVASRVNRLFIIDPLWLRPEGMQGRANRAGSGRASGEAGYDAIKETAGRTNSTATAFGRRVRLLPTFSSNCANTPPGATRLTAW